MTYFINPIWFYLIDLAQNLRGLSILLIIASVCIIAVKILYNYMEDEVLYNDKEGEGKKLKWKKTLPFLIVGIIIISFVPSKETCIEMMVASQVTKENVNYSIETVKDITDYVSEKIKGEK